ncbi:glycogen synthase [Nitrospirota bacterium]
MPAGGRVWEYSVLEDGKGAYLIDCPELFDRDEIYGTGAGDYSDNPLRFSFFCRAVLEAASAMDIRPEIVHVHDWQTALLPVYMKTTHRDSFPDAATVLTIHNLGYQGLFSPSAIWDTGLPEDLYNNGTFEFFGQLNFLKAGIIAADSVSTVSRTYAREIMTPESGFGLDGVLMDRADNLFGIVNGLDYSEWDPAADLLIPARYNASDMGGKSLSKRAFSENAGFDDIKRPLAGVVSRLAHQKGIDLVVEAGREMVEMGFNVAVLGRGDAELEESLRDMAKELKGSFWVSLLHDERAAHEVYAASDIFLMPSRYEPCGLSQLISMKYGTVPVARATGGIADTVVDFSRSDSGTGFTFKRDDAPALLECLERALKVYGDRPRWGRLMSNAMRSEFSWDKSAKGYIDLFEKTLARTGGTGV